MTVMTSAWLPVIAVLEHQYGVPKPYYLKINLMNSSTLLAVVLRPLVLLQQKDQEVKTAKLHQAQAYSKHQEVHQTQAFRNLVLLLDT